MLIESLRCRALASPIFELQWANAEFAVLRLKDAKVPHCSTVVKIKELPLGS